MSDGLTTALINLANQVGQSTAAIEGCQNDISELKTSHQRLESKLDLALAGTQKKTKKFPTIKISLGAGIITALIGIFKAH